MSDPDEEILTPAAGLAQRAEHATAQLHVGGVERRALLLLADNLAAAAVERSGARLLPYRAAQAPLWSTGRVTLCAPGVGAPAAALATEKLIAAGAELIVAVGWAGGLGELGRGRLVAATGTLRGEEGVSGHYGADGDRVPANAGVARALAMGADAAGLIVTTDAPYRETRRKVAAWRAAGALAVEMETAGVLAPARFRGARAGAVVIVTDTLGEAWRPAAVGSVEQAAARALALALDVLERLG